MATGGLYNCPYTYDEGSCPCGYKNHVRASYGMDEAKQVYYACFTTRDAAEDHEGALDNQASSGTKPSDKPTNGKPTNGKPTNGAQSGAAGNFADFWKYAFNFFNPGAEGIEDPTITNMLNVMLNNLILPLAFVLFAALIIMQGVKYIFAATADKKASAKEGLIGIVISGVLIFRWNTDI